MQKTPKRPANVPEGARWVAPLWQYGTLDAKGGAQGLWCGWKKNGALAYVAMVKDDATQGPCVEFHPDGSLFRRATYAGGEPEGEEEMFAPLKKSDEIFPAAKPVVRMVVDHATKGAPKKFFLKGAVECNEQGTPLSALHCDAPFLVQEPEVFATKTLPAYLKHRLKVAPTAAARAKAPKQAGLTKSVAALWGVKPRGSFKVALSLLERARLPKYLDHFNVDTVSALSGQGAGATAELLLLQAQRSVGALPAGALFSGLVPIALDGGGNVFSLSVHDDYECALYSVGREEGDLLVESDNAFFFLAWSAAAEANGEGMLSSRARAHLARLFAGHLRHTQLGDVRWREAPFDAKETEAQKRLRRSAWLTQLLAGEPLDFIVDQYETQEAAALDGALVARLGRPQGLLPPDLIYALFRSYVVSDPRTAALCDVAQASASSLVVSSATLVRELLGGRTRLGKVKDLGAMARATQKALFR